MLIPHQALQQLFGINDFRPSQREIIESVMTGNNTLATLPTGSGKSLTFQLPALILEGTTIVISPLLSLIRDQVQKLQHQGVEVYQIDSTLSDLERHQNLTAIENGRAKIIYTSPETLSNPQVYKLLKTLSISIIAIDEAHCYSEWGHSFRPSYLSLPILSRGLKPHAILALTATATRKVSADIRRAFKIKTAHHFSSSPRRDNLHYTIIPSADKERRNHLRGILQRADHLPAVVYVMRQEQCEEIAGYLNTHHYNARSYHAGMTTNARTKIQDDFLHDTIDIIVATIAFGMGVDKPNIRSITHYHLPKSPEGWLQESGRAGRDGLTAHAYLIACGDDLIPLTNFSRARQLDRQTITRLIQHIASQGRQSVIQPYHLRVNLEILSSTLDVLLAKLELMRTLKYRHTSWRYVQLNQIYNTPFQINDYPKSQRIALQSLLDRNDRYEITQARNDFNIDPEKLYQTLLEIKQSGECRVKFSGWQKHYSVSKTLQPETIPSLSEQLYLYHQEQLKNANQRLDAVHKIATSKRCIPSHLEQWFSVKSPLACGQCSSCLNEARPRKLPSITIPELSEQDLLDISQLLKHRGKRLNTPQKLTRFLCGIPTPYLRHYFLYKDPRFGMLKDTPYDEVHAYSKALMS